jgi:hypothetical protein
MRLLVLSILMTVVEAAGACGFHGALGDGFSAMHPRSLDVAFAVRDAADAKLVDPALLDPQKAGPLGYLRATARARDFWLRLGEAPTALLFVESGLWTRFVKGAPEFHAAGAQAGDVVIVTSEAVIAEILADRMSIPQAAESGLLVRLP